MRRRQLLKEGDPQVSKLWNRLVLKNYDLYGVMNKRKLQDANHS